MPVNPDSYYAPGGGFGELVVFLLFAWFVGAILWGGVKSLWADFATWRTLTPEERQAARQERRRRRRALEEDPPF